ncbi:MAG: DUF2029 domain-containing protein [Chlorobiaceae bacterium]|nr:DUF2029 domain-containing protein [Chlorobiaceae bacterium]
MKSREHWLNSKRLSFYPPIFLIFFFLIGLGSWLMSKNMVDLNGIALGGDFIAFWAASYLALTGHAQDVFNTSVLFKAQQIAVPASQQGYLWLYPPTFFLMILPLALLPYKAAYWAFMLSTLGACLLVLQRIVHGKTAMWCIAAFSGLWVNLLCGQNAFLTATLAGAALLSLERRPVLSGLFIGLLAIKPHLAVLFPVALIAIGAWRALITAAVTAFTFTTIGTITLGTTVLWRFLSNLGYARFLLENGLIHWSNIPTLFAFGRLIGIPVPWAYVLHFVIALGAVTVLWYVWRHCQDWKLRSAALMTATFLVSPYVVTYDLVWIAFPIAWLASSGQDKGWLPGEREVLVAAWLLPLLMIPIPGVPPVPFGPLVLCSLLWITFRRSATSSMTEAATTGAHPDQNKTLP